MCTAMKEALRVAGTVRRYMAGCRGGYVGLGKVG